MSYVFPFLSMFPTFQSVLSRATVSSFITQGLLSVLPDVQDLFSEVSMVASLVSEIYVSARAAMLNRVHLTPSSCICPTQTNKTIASAQVLLETVAEDCTDECPASALPASQSADVLDIVECIGREHRIEKGKQKEEYRREYSRLCSRRTMDTWCTCSHYPPI
ncbi:hypothetical protein NEOLEDRAFT_797632 [Neolentinus lepideus HHB14362 ss-1]|uniref:Uncharacterized protein n=1 Tax=Neolentinus lepideus HHB14362 ss-1 TaxID=1314782 RepID=A0A165PH79_9AGAM|nr:hypothetical protein NEOLEDRAFT_797632 [Neolentinus lepideus HHB14362 ss-1]